MASWQTDRLQVALDYPSIRDLEVLAVVVNKWSKSVSHSCMSLEMNARRETIGQSTNRFAIIQHMNPFDYLAVQRDVAVTHSTSEVVISEGANRLAQTC